ncbi:MAG: tetratricopeptide repeat protein [bacterium]
MLKPGFSLHVRAWAFTTVGIVLFLAAGCALTPAPTAELKQTEALDLLMAGVKHEAAGEYELALQDYLKSNQVSPRPATYFHIGNCFTALNQHSRAVPYYEKALELAPDFDEARYALYQAQFKAEGEIVAVAPTQPAQKPAPPKETPSEAREDTAAPVREPVVENTQTRLATQTDDKSEPAPLPGTQQAVSEAETEKPAMEIASSVAQPVAVEPSAATTAPTPDPAQAPATGTPKTENETPSPPATTPPTESVQKSEETPAAPSEPAVPPPGLGMKALEETVKAVAGEKKQVTLPPMDDVREVLFGGGATRDASASAEKYPQDRKVILGTFSYHVSKGDSLRKRNEYDRAAAEYLEALDYKSDDLECRLLLADMYKAAGRYEKAETHYFRAYRQAPSNARTLFKIGNFYLTLGKKADAINWFEKTLTLDPDYFYAHNNLGVLYMENGDAPKALTHFEAARRQEPTYANTYLNLGILYQDHLKEPAKAIEVYEKYVELGGPRSDEVKSWLDTLKK